MVMNKDKVAVLADSGCDISADFVEKYGIYVTPLHIIYPEKDYADGVDIDPMMVYERFPDEYPTTSTPSLAEVHDMFQKIKDDGYEKVIAVMISSGLSVFKPYDDKCYNDVFVRADRMMYERNSDDTLSVV